MKIVVFTAALFAVVVSSCASAPAPVQLTPLEIQAMQTREFEASKDTVFQATVSMFQDLGYTINNADFATGFISTTSAAKTLEIPTSASLFAAATVPARTVQTRATAIVENSQNGITRVRLNFVEGTQSSTVTGQQSADDKPILSSTIYQNAFDRLETSVFMRLARSND